MLKKYVKGSENIPIENYGWFRKENNMA